MQCRGHADQLGRSYYKFQAQDAEALVIGGGDVADAARIVSAFNLPFLVLADPEREVYQRYGLDKLFFILQRSGTIIVDKKGIVRYINQVTNPKASMNITELLGELEKLN